MMMETVMFEEIYRKAREKGLEAGHALVPTPMVVYEADLEGNRIGPDYEPIMDGACGFAWIIVKPGNSKFANWLKKNELARKDSYYGGVSIWVSDYNQSHEKKAAYAKAFAEVLKVLLPELRVVAMDRLD